MSNSKSRESRELFETRWAHELLTAADPGMTVEQALVAQQKRSDGGPSSIGYETGARIILRLVGIASRTKLLDMTCDEICERIKLRGLWTAVEAEKSGRAHEDPPLDDPCAGDGGDPYDEPLPTARRATRAEAREIAGRRVDARMLDSMGDGN